MNTAQLIVRVLDASMEFAYEDELDPLVRKYAVMLKERYKQLKKTKDFATAARQSKTDIVLQIQLDHSAVEPGEEIPPNRPVA